MNNILDKILTWIGNNKLATFFGICLFCFIITTIVISSQKSSLNAKLEECENSKKTTEKPPSTTTNNPNDNKSTTTSKKPNVNKSTTTTSTTSTTQKQGGGDDNGGEGGIPDETPKQGNLIAAEEPNFMNAVEDNYNYDSLPRIAKRFVPMLANA